MAFIVTGETENDAKIKSKNIMKQEQDWYEANSFLINSNKNENIRFSLRGTVDEEQKPVKLLGLMLGSKLLWDPHIKLVTSNLKVIEGVSLVEEIKR